MKKTEQQKEMEHQKEMKQIRQLEEWTGLQWGEVVFDSDKDNWSVNTSVFDDKIKGKKQLLFVIENDVGEKSKEWYFRIEVKKVC